MSGDYNELTKQFATIARLEHAIKFLQWDQLVKMPPAGSNARADAMAELFGLHHQLLTARELGDLLAMARQQTDSTEHSRSVLEMERKRQRALCLPQELVKAKAIAGSKCEQDWRGQRQDNDWPGFLQNFRQVLRLAQEEAQARKSSADGAFATPYDAMLDLYCTGDSSARITEVFAELASQLPQLFSHILEKQAAKLRVACSGGFNISDQKQLSHCLMELLGFDFQAGRLDQSMHPFSIGGRGDQRITTRFREDEFLEALQATAHETGHAAYESGLPEEFDGLPVGESRNMCIHESQSHLFEKHIFLARPFISYFTTYIHKFLADSRSYSDEQIWAQCTKVERQLIRVEADEVSYPLHVMVRFDIEKELINGDLAADDIPERWNEAMVKYLGLATGDNYRDGCLQDIHWTDGSFGYFPSYTMGTLNAAQFSAAITVAYPDCNERLGRGDVSFVRDWLSENVWRRASTMDSQEIVLRATSQETNPEYFLQHIKARYLADQY